MDIESFASVMVLSLVCIAVALVVLIQQESWK